MSDETITLEVFRYHPGEGGTPMGEFQRYEVPYHAHWVVLDALNWIKDNVDGTLSYRWSCRMGVCGSCGMMVNGEPKLTCAVFLKDYYTDRRLKTGAALRVEPLANFPVERDLVIVMDDFMAKLKAVKPWIIRKDDRPARAGLESRSPADRHVPDKPPEGEYLQTSRQLAQYKQYSMCINCMLCYAACPELAGEPDFLGPAAIALAQRYNLDSRDEGRDQRQEVLGGRDAVWDCTFVGECTKVCPENVDPAGAIQQAKVAAAKDWYKHLLMPWGQR